jgi:hypothetical protein
MTKHRLEAIQQHGPRIQIVDEIAFVYDSMTLEGPLATYLIEWGSRRIIEKAQRYVNATGEVAYHTFLFPVKKVCVSSPLGTRNIRVI